MLMSDQDYLIEDFWIELIIRQTKLEISSKKSNMLETVR